MLHLLQTWLTFNELTNIMFGNNFESQILKELIWKGEIQKISSTFINLELLCYLSSLPNKFLYYQHIIVILESFTQSNDNRLVENKNMKLLMHHMSSVALYQKNCILALIIPFCLQYSGVGIAALTFVCDLIKEQPSILKEIDMFTFHPKLTNCWNILQNPFINISEANTKLKIYSFVEVLLISQDRNTIFVEFFTFTTYLMLYDLCKLKQLNEELLKLKTIIQQSLTSIEVNQAKLLSRFKLNSTLSLKLNNILNLRYHMETDLNIINKTTLLLLQTQIKALCNLVDLTQYLKLLQ